MTTSYMTRSNLTDCHVQTCRQSSQSTTFGRLVKYWQHISCVRIRGPLSSQRRPQQVGEIATHRNILNKRGESCVPLLELSQDEIKKACIYIHLHRNISHCISFNNLKKERKQVGVHLVWSIASVDGSNSFPCSC
jgi:hypothetical protein